MSTPHMYRLSADLQSQATLGERRQVRMSSRVWATPSPSQSPMEPPT